MSDYDIQILNGNDFLITQNYGENPQDYAKFGYPFHIGLDIVSQSGKDWNIETVLGGVVKYAGLANGGYGNIVIILQDDNVLAKYMHLESIFVKPNQRVEQLQEIGIIGNTGNSTGRHLHLEFSIWDGNIWGWRSHFDPLPYLNKLDDEYKARNNNKTTNSNNMSEITEQLTKINKAMEEAQNSPSFLLIDEPDRNAFMGWGRNYVPDFKYLVNQLAGLYKYINQLKNNIEGLMSNITDFQNQIGRMNKQVEDLKAENANLRSNNTNGDPKNLVEINELKLINENLVKENNDLNNLLKSKQIELDQCNVKLTQNQANNEGSMGQVSDVKKKLNAFQGFIKNNISTITTLIGSFGFSISQDQTSQIANGIFIGLGFAVSAYFEWLNRK